MEIIIRKTSKLRSRAIALVCFIALIASVLFVTYAQVSAQPVLGHGQRLITIYDRGQDRGILTAATTLRQAFEEASIHLDPNDTVEPGLDQPLVATNYDVNIYRARPVTIIDGNIRKKIMSPHQTADQIAKQAGMQLQKEDRTTITANTDMISQGAGVQLTIDRATPLKLVMYGMETTVYTHAATVGELLEEKDINLSSEDIVSIPLDTKIAKNMTISLWRNGVQTVTVEEALAFETEKILDPDQPIGYRHIKTPGVEGKRTVSYEVNIQDGQELSRKEIQSLTTKHPEKQVEIVGAKPPAGGLTKSKGAQYFTDSNGVSHRETYYDLPMNVVMNACGGGTYTIRADGAKIDQEGFILVAANLQNYPRCSVVETSLGPGKVYDTGGFAERHPHGFDLATDWTNNDGV
jgi:uncharacterized protein YabE (DUF348 family)